MAPIKIGLLVIGAGPAGYTAAIYAARANLQPVLVTGMQPGGQLTTTTGVENFPGFPAVQGPDRMERMRHQAEHVGTRVIYDTITSVDLSRDPIVARGDSGDTYLAEALIIATGVQAKWLGVPGEEDDAGYGISACAVRDGFDFRGKHTAVIGGENTTVDEALYLTNHASKAILIHRGDRPRAESIMRARLFNHPRIAAI